MQTITVRTAGTAYETAVTAEEVETGAVVQALLQHLDTGFSPLAVVDFAETLIWDAVTGAEKVRRLGDAEAIAVRN